MGKKRINQLLERLKENQQSDLHNAAAIYTVAQLAVNELQEIAESQPMPPLALSPALPTALTQAELLQRYGSYNGCRSAAKKLGIHFPKSPSWLQLVAAFTYAEVFRQLAQDYVHQQGIAHLSGVRFTVQLE